jgi:hypothetical protein
MEINMKTILFAIAAIFVVNVSYAENACEMKAAEKKLNGAAKNSFIKKCEKDARAVCENDEISKRTNGAAKEAHIKKCVKDSLGN